MCYSGRNDSNASGSNGSFAQVYGHLPKEDLAKRLRKVLLHEFRHHLESLAGERDLEIEDAIEIAEYRERRGI